jgi:hypothetical protein
VATPAGEALTKAQQLALTKRLETQTDPLLKTETRWALEDLAPAAPLKSPADYAGVYGGRSIAIQDGRLRLVQGRRPPLSLKPLAADTFAVEGAAVPTRITFERDGADKITGLVQSLSSGQASRFARTD